MLNRIHHQIWSLDRRQVQVYLRHENPQQNTVWKTAEIGVAVQQVVIY